MKSNKFYKIACLTIYLIGLIWTVKAQDIDKKAVEQEYLTKTRINIEKFRKGDAIINLLDAAGKPVKNVKVEINQVSQDFLFGNLSEEIFSPGLTASDFKKFEDHFLGLYNFTELTIKWEPYEPEMGKPRWEHFQKCLDWCKKNGVTPKGHTIGWTHSAGTPAWVLSLPDKMVFDLYKARIYNLVGGFKKYVEMWDVVNEALNTVPMEIALQDSVFLDSEINAGSNRYDVSGITLDQVYPWVESSFNWAFEANPSAHLMVNEYNIVSTPSTREKYYVFIKELLNRKVPVKGIGIQAHEPRETWFSPVEVMASFDRFNDLKLPLHITEFIPQSSGNKILGGWREGSWTEEAQAEFAEQFFTLAFSHPLMVSIHWWGLSDRMIWLKGGGLLDENFNPKPVYTRLKKLIKEEWMTKNLVLSTDKKGQANFRGFFGNYQIMVTKADGSKQNFDIHLKEGENNNYTFKL